MSWIAVVGAILAVGGVLLMGFAFAVVRLAGSAPTAGTERSIPGPDVPWPLGGTVAYGCIRVAARELDTDNNPLHRNLFTVEVGNATPHPEVTLHDPFRRWRGQPAQRTQVDSWNDLPPALTQGRQPVPLPRGALIQSMAVRPGDVVIALQDTVYIGTVEQLRASGMARLTRVRAVAAVSAMGGLACGGVGLVLTLWGLL